VCAEGFPIGQPPGADSVELANGDPPRDARHQDGAPPRDARVLQGFLGFRVAMDEDGMLMLASTSTPTTQVIVAWESATAVDPELLAVDVSIEVADVDEAFARARAMGLEIVRGLRDERWGSAASSCAMAPDERSTSLATHSPPNAASLSSLRLGGREGVTWRLKAVRRLCAKRSASETADEGPARQRRRPRREPRLLPFDQSRRRRRRDRSLRSETGPTGSLLALIGNRATSTSPDCVDNDLSRDRN
jgi:hypothetical protein